MAPNIKPGAWRATDYGTVVETDGGGQIAAITARFRGKERDDLATMIAANPDLLSAAKEAATRWCAPAGSMRGDHWVAIETGTWRALRDAVARAEPPVASPAKSESPTCYTFDEKMPEPGTWFIVEAWGGQDLYVAKLSVREAQASDEILGYYAANSSNVRCIGSRGELVYFLKNRRWMPVAFPPRENKAQQP